jgi:hypothetical protein
MGHGFTGVAYRFRAATEYQSEFAHSYRAPGGAAPPADEHYRQERALFGFFVSGLACLESFAFALHAIASHYAASTFGLAEKDLRSVTPEAVTAALQKVWPSAALTTVMSGLVQDTTFQTWKAIRNVLAHRIVPSRAITATIGSKVQSSWRLNGHYSQSPNEPLENATESRLIWLSKHIRDLWEAVEESFPPP